MNPQDTHAQFIVHRMERGEVDRIREWAIDEGWNPGLHDAGCFFETDPNGFFVGELNGECAGRFCEPACD
jgi:hypothetical protein